jgi:hypothetical protein
MDKIFIQNSEHDVDRDDGGQNQQWLIGQRGLKRGGRTLESRLNAGRHVHVFLNFLHYRDGIAQRGVLREIERDRDAGNCP